MRKFYKEVSILVKRLAENIVQRWARLKPDSKRAKLFFIFFKLGCVSFGGGYALIPLIEREVVTERKWVEKEKVTDIMAVAGTLPGAIAVNASAFIGYEVARLSGAIMAVLGNLTPSVIIITVLSVVLTGNKDLPAVEAAFRGIYPAIVAMIGYASYRIIKTLFKDPVSLAILIISIVGAFLPGVSPLVVMLFGALAGLGAGGAKSLIAANNRNKAEKL